MRYAHCSTLLVAANGRAMPSSVTILANQNSATFTVTGVNDALRDGTQTAVITASAAGVASTTANASVTDDELDIISLSLSTDLMSESGGSITGTVTRIDLDNSAALVVSLSSSNTGEATVPATVTIPASQNGVTFAITAVDEAVADRAQTVTITASAAGHAAVNKNLIVSDNETPFQNPRHPLDVTGDGFIVAGDVLAVINIINEIGTGAVGIIMPQYSGPPIFPDTSGDNFISALDALLVINHVNDPPTPRRRRGVRCFRGFRSRGERFSRQRFIWPNSRRRHIRCRPASAARGRFLLATNEIPHSQPPRRRFRLESCRGGCGAGDCPPAGGIRKRVASPVPRTINRPLTRPWS